ncbi:hypothetical protein [Fusibacter sp. JL216-2]|uniref:hypothetical protein n=1 Tax=Fusibacter sp. JL216-2 TaxID=3071453 RepID=UPI003D357453
MIRKGLKYSKSQIEAMNQEKQKPNREKQKPNREKQKTFDEKYKRHTTYIEYDLYDEIQVLREAKAFRTTTDFINDAIKRELESY